jgi:exosome complex component RRP40
MAKNKRKSHFQKEDEDDENDDGGGMSAAAAVPSRVKDLPGDNVTAPITKMSAAAVAADDSPQLQQQQGVDPKKIQLGSGLRWGSSSSRHDIFATMAGRLESRRAGNTSKTVFFVRPNHKRYQEIHAEDRIVGIIEDRMGSDGAGGDLYRVNIGASHPATISNLSGFEGATKRNKPQLQTGQVIYARVVAPTYPVNSSSSSSSHGNNHGCGILDPVLSCQLGPHDGNLPRKDWMTSETLYGVLKGGTVCRISTGLARSLLHPDSVVLAELAQSKALAFEVAVGVNGFLWIHSTAPEYTILIQNAICNSAVLTPAQVRGMVKQLVYTVRKQMQQDHVGAGGFDDNAMQE